MRILLSVILFLTACGAAYAQHAHSPPESAEPIALLFGLVKSLTGQGKKYAAGLVRREFETAWSHADIELRVEDL